MVIPSPYCGEFAIIIHVPVFQYYGDSLDLVRHFSGQLCPWILPIFTGVGYPLRAQRLISIR